MEANPDFSVVTIFYFLAVVAIALAVKLHFPQGFVLYNLSRLLRLHRFFF